MISQSESNQIKQILSQKKEQFSVEIRRKKNKCQIERNRQAISLRFNEIIHTNYEHTAAVNIYKQIVKEYDYQTKQQSSQAFILLSDEEFQIQLANLENYSSDTQYYIILKSLIYINAYLRINNMSRINISEKMMDNLADISASYKQQQTPENYFLAIMALQSISVISYFPINVEIFKEKLFKSLFTWIDCKIIQLQCNSFQAIYLVSCSDESIMQKLFTQYDLLSISVNQLKSTITKLKCQIQNKKSSQQNPQKNNLEEILKQLILQIVRIIQDYQILSKKNKYNFDSKISNQLLIESATKTLQEHKILDLSSSIICCQIIKMSLNQQETFDMTFNYLSQFSIIPVFYEIIGSYVMNFTESKAYQQLVETIVNIICIISSCDNTHVSQLVYQSNNHLKTLVDLLIKERSKINIISLKIIHNICFDNASAKKFILESDTFWQNLMIITDFSTSQELIKEILLLLFLIADTVTDSTVDQFINCNGFQIIHSILHKFQIPQFIIISFDILNALFDYIIQQQQNQSLQKFLQLCSKFQIIDLAESFCTNHQIQNNVQNSIFHFLNKLDTQCDFLNKTDHLALVENKQFNDFKQTPASLIYKNLN